GRNQAVLPTLSKGEAGPRNRHHRLVPPPRSSHRRRGFMSTLEAKETSRLIAADKVEGTAVYNAAQEKIGSIENIMIDKLSGKVAYAVMSFGGFLGIGD